MRRNGGIVVGCVAALLAIVAVAVGRGEAAESRYTSVRDADCAGAPADLKTALATRERPTNGRGQGSGSELGVQECAAFGGWRLLLVSADPRSWFELWRAGQVWSGEHVVAYDQPIGQFPTVAASDKVEWRRSADGFWRALIFRVEAGRPEDAPGKVYKLFVVRIAGEHACFIGKAATNEEARALADGPNPCPDAWERLQGGTSPKTSSP